MTKDLLQQELLEKIKPGTKPSDLKKRTISIPTPPDSPLIEPIKTYQDQSLKNPAKDKLKQLQQKANF